MSLRIRRQLLLAPAVRDRAQQRDQRRRGRRDHALAHAVFDQLRILLKGGTEEHFPRQKHHHEFGRRREVLRVVLAAEGRDVIAHLARVIDQQLRARLFIRTSAASR